MLTFYKPISWSKFKLAINCPRALQFDLEYTPRKPAVTYWQAVGLVVQRTFELYYSRGIYKNPNGRNEDTL